MFKAMIKKEFLLVFRDKHALLALFVMPAIFILIMSVAMRDQFTSKNIEFSLFIVDIDKSEISKKLVSDVKKNNKFNIQNKKDAQFVLRIPKDYTKDILNKVEIDVQDSLKNNQIEIFKFMLSQYLLNAKRDATAKMMNSMKKKNAQKVLNPLSSMNLSVKSLYSVKYNNSSKIPNATQQSVPSWIVFGMFFIIIPMSTIYVNERKQNTLLRLSSMNISIFAMTFSKSIPYLIINQIQVLIMLGVGIFIVPLFNTPALAINGSWLALGVLSFSLSLAAIGISSLIAVSANSSEQATTIGGILNILLGAVGGVMVPKFIMPDSMQKLAEFSPMSWGLDGFLDIFLKSANLNMIINDVLKLAIFGLLFLMISMLILHRRINEGH